MWCARQQGKGSAASRGYKDARQSWSYAHGTLLQLPRLLLRQCNSLLGTEPEQCGDGFLLDAPEWILHLAGIRRRAAPQNSAIPVRNATKTESALPMAWARDGAGTAHAAGSSPLARYHSAVPRIPVCKSTCG